MLGVLALTGALAACSSSRYGYKVEAYQDPTATSASSYVIVSPGRTAVAGRAADTLRAFLGERGLREAPLPRDADLEISIQCDISRPRRRLMPNRHLDFLDEIKVSSLPYPEADVVQTGKESGGPMKTELRMVTNKRVVIAARHRGGAESWRVEASIENENANLEACVPALVEAALRQVRLEMDQREAVPVVGGPPSRQS